MRTITKLEFLKHCLKYKVGVTQKRWYVTAFTIPLLKETDLADYHEGDIAVKADGLYAVLQKEDDEAVGLEFVKLSDYKPKEPLYRWTDEVTVDSDWLDNIQKEEVTSIGILILNAVAFAYPVGKKIPFLNKRGMKPSTIEHAIAIRLANTDEAVDGSISMAEAIQCIDGMNFLEFVGTFTNTAATPKSITAPKGARELKEKLFRENKDKLGDSVEVTKIANQLQAFDKEYLKDDPAAQAYFTGKATASRTKLHYFGGQGLDFKEGSNNLITKSLGEGIETNQSEFPKWMNDSRYASFSRGGKTAQGGYTYKILQRSLSSIVIVGTPCGTKKGHKRLIEKGDLTKYVNRYYKKGEGWVLFKSVEEVVPFEGKVLEIRSPIYCIEPGNNICYACLSEHYKHSRDGVTNISAAISSIILNTALKLMHNSAMGAATIELSDLAS